MKNVVYRFNSLFSLLGNVLYISMIYFLWRSIYQDADMIKGMAFNQTFVYLALASTVFTLFKTLMEWRISSRILNGTIIVDLLKPLDHQMYMLFLSLGDVVFNLVMTTIPSLLLIKFVFKADIYFGVNIFFFIISIGLGYLLSFFIDYSVGMMAFYTESIWGISMTKEVIVLFLSGALIPLAFFPESALDLLEFLPFQALYHIPLVMITSPNLEIASYLSLLLKQFLWVIVLCCLSRLFYRQAVKILAINGG